jgi:hypothetical protein
MVYDDILGSYSSHMADLKNDDLIAKYWIKDYFKSESAAVQLMNPNMVNSLFKNIVK